MRSTKQINVFAISIASKQEQVILDEDEAQRVRTHDDIRHTASLAICNSIEEAQEQGLRTAERALPSADGWEHHIQANPFILSITGEGTFDVHLSQPPAADAQDIDGEG